MKVRSVTFDENERPATFTVEMTVDEAALLYAFVGQVPTKDVTDLAGEHRWLAALEGACDLDTLFNMFWEDGWRDVGPSWRVRLEAK